MRPFLILLAALSFACTSQARSAAIEPLAPAIIPSSQQFDFTSEITGEAYRVRVLIPRGPPPPGGYPTLYVLDGDTLFGTFAGAARSRSQAGEIAPAVIVGIDGAPGPGGANRTYDFSPTPLSAKEKTIITELVFEKKFGGSERFFQVIQSEIKPKIAALASIDPKRTALFGWSSAASSSSTPF